MSEHTVLFVDDEPNILKAVQRLLRHEPVRVLCTSRGVEALELLDKTPAQVVVSDQRMPEMCGVDLLSAVRERHGDVVRMMMTGHTDMHVAVDAINRGEIYRLITKPWNDEELKATLRQAFDHWDLKHEIRRLNQVTREQNFKLQDMNRTLEEKVRERTKQLDDKHRELRTAYVETIRALAEAVDAKDAYTRGHSERVGVYASKIARELGGFPKEFIERVYIAGLLHDVGKIGVRDAVITKPDRLTPAEYEEIKRHPEIGARILEPVTFLSDVASCVRHHHEWYDGSEHGYPKRLRGDDIPLPSRIILVADTVEAMTSDRPYRRGLSLDNVISELRRFSGSQFDPAVVKPCLRLLEREGDSFIKKDQKFEIYAFLEA
ncbi:MAG TPA: HD domain-containing phosphohydrolase [Myxococcota bacterium]|jgi:putative nucleotidyltransferase with HDIG domain|nr:HD domain-containing phosphohydrolase [Myxococcota bacterium]